LQNYKISLFFFSVFSTEEFEATEEFD